MTSLPADSPPAAAAGGPRPFVLRRFLDVSGVSGEGDVAEGVQWSDGTVSLRWPGEHPSVTFWQDGISSVEAVHGHGGATAVVFLVDEPAPPAADRAADRSAEPAVLRSAVSGHRQVVRR
jgi:hypothetical protein